MARTTRREFLKQMAITGAAATGLPAALEAAEKAIGGAKGKSRIVIATDKNVLKDEDEVVQHVLDKMLERCISKLTDSRTGAEGWKKLFKPSDVVG
ncbi:MAG: twin-arginine translocation signal domain-containing protein, partial [Armatimonadota bacterium]